MPSIVRSVAVFSNTLPVEQGAVEAGQVVHRRDEAAAAVEVEGGVEAGRVDALVVLVRTGVRSRRRRFERLEVGAR